MIPGLEEDLNPVSERLPRPPQADCGELQFCMKVDEKNRLRSHAKFRRTFREGDSMKLKLKLKDDALEEIDKELRDIDARLKKALSKTEALLQEMKEEPADSENKSEEEAE